MFKQTALTSIDSYKLGHAEQYPEGITKVYSNFTPRSSNHFNAPAEYKDNRIVWFGLQIFLTELNEVWRTTFFEEEWGYVELEAKELYAAFCGPNGFDTDRLKALYDLGYLPIEIKALPEGLVVPVGVPVLTITNTLPEFAWLPNFLETWMSCELWKSCTSATTSLVYRKIIEKYAALTKGNTDFINWQGHDFSVRGMSGIIDAAKSGAGHLLSFTGTDNLPAVKLVNDVYFGKATFVGGSVPATEHSVMCAGGRESELETFRRLIKTYPSGIISIVSDTWDFWNVITVIAKELKNEILDRTPDQFGIAKVVFRPDSGDPVKIICGHIWVNDGVCYTGEMFDQDVTAVRTETGEFWEIEYTFDSDGFVDEYRKVKQLSEPEVKGAVECLWDIFGGYINTADFRTISQRVGLIYGDSITPQRAEEILENLMAKGFASDNVVFGIGSYTFQYQTRDTLGFAMKATYVEINGEGQAIFKDPKTDSGTKKSAKGLLQVLSKDGEPILRDNVTKEEEMVSLLRTVYKDGEIKVLDSFADVRSRLGVL